MSSDPVPDITPQPFIDPIRLAFPGMQPDAGSRWRRKGSGSIAVVLEVVQGRFAWVRIRMQGRETTVQLSTFERSFDRL